MATLSQRRIIERHLRKAPSGPAPCFLFAGGGTGGHLFPGLAVAAELAQLLPRASLVFAGTGRDTERDRVARAGFEYLGVPSHPLVHDPRQLLRCAYRNVAGYRRVGTWLEGRRVTAVIGLGGYAAVPAVLAARRRGIPTFLLEQNLVPGKGTRWLARGAETVFASFADTCQMLARSARVCCTGNPLREEIVRLCSVASRTQRLKRPPAERRTLLVTGGSQGAHSLNRAVLAALSRLADLHDRWQVIHQTGEQDYSIVCQQYAQLPWSADVQPFFAEMAPVYQQADLAVCRAGATTLSELACAGVPAILLPYPHAAADHQSANARFYEQRGAATIVVDRPDGNGTSTELIGALSVLMHDPDRLRAHSFCMRTLARPGAASDVAQQIILHTRVTV